MASANAAKTHCPRNHPYSGDNLVEARGRRDCRICARERNRLAQQRRRGEWKGRARGERHGLAKLTAEDVREIRSSALSQRQLAKLYPVSRAEIGYVQRRVVWAHV